MRSALGSLTLLFITSAWSPQSTLQPGGAGASKCKHSPCPRAIAAWDCGGMTRGGNQREVWGSEILV